MQPEPVQVRSLAQVKAAEALGMSRATICRKIREYGVVAPAGI